MVEQGDKNIRIQQTLKNIGPAVLNGGVSTFLAFILLATSKSHVFSTFFKIFFLVVIFGLYHGLVFLPVILSIAGPRANIVDVVLSDEFRSEPNKEDARMNITVNTAENIDGRKASSEDVSDSAATIAPGGTNPNTYKIWNMNA